MILYFSSESVRQPKLNALVELLDERGILARRDVLEQVKKLDDETSEAKYSVMSAFSIVRAHSANPATTATPPRPYTAITAQNRARSISSMAMSRVAKNFAVSQASSGLLMFRLERRRLTVSRFAGRRIIISIRRCMILTLCQES